MANTKVIITEKKLNNGWWNIKTTDGKDIAINAEKNPKLNEAIEKVDLLAQVQPEIEMNLVEKKDKEKGDKNYGWDIKEPANKPTGNGGGKKYTQQDPKILLVGTAMSYAKDLCVSGVFPLKEMYIEYPKIFEAMCIQLEKIQKSE